MSQYKYLIIAVLYLITFSLLVKFVFPPVHWAYILLVSFPYYFFIRRILFEIEVLSNNLKVIRIKNYQINKRKTNKRNYRQLYSIGFLVLFFLMNRYLFGMKFEDVLPILKLILIFFLVFMLIVSFDNVPVISYNNEFIRQESDFVRLKIYWKDITGIKVENDVLYIHSKDDKEVLEIYLKYLSPNEAEDLIKTINNYSPFVLD